MSQLEKSKSVYESIEIPDELQERVQTGLNAAKHGKKHRKSFFAVTIGSSFAVAACAIFILLLNTSQTFANSIYAIPVLGSLAKVVTFREYENINDIYAIEVKAPKISGTGQTTLEQKINDTIQEKIDALIADVKARGEEMESEWIADGKDQDNMPHFSVNVDYEIKSSSKDVLSFVVNDSETYASCYTYQTFYNLDLKNGKEITISDLLGPDYMHILDKEIRGQMKERIATHPDYMYDDFSTEEVLKNPEFYINQKGNPVISFEKSVIAPGAMGIQEFEIELNH